MNDFPNLFDLSNKVFVITGGAGLLGFNHAEAILLSGGYPIILDVNEKALKKTYNKLAKKT